MLALGTRRGLFFRLKTMQKIKDFETFAAGYFLGLGIKKPTAEDICRREAFAFTPAPSPHFHQKAFTCRRPLRRGVLLRRHLNAFFHF